MPRNNKDWLDRGEEVNNNNDRSETRYNKWVTGYRDGRSQI